MPRKPRFNLIGVPQHIVQRGNNREPCFFAEQDYRRYLTDLEEVACKHDCRIHAYVLMTNYVHILATPFKDHGLSLMMQAQGRRFVKYVNHTYRRTGTLWEGRYKSCLIDSDHYLLTCMRYIELNPVRARMVEHPGEYKWSSYHANVQGKSESLIADHPLYRQLGKDKDEREHAYRELFRLQLESDSLHEIREALNHELVLGRTYFKERNARITERRTTRRLPGRPRIEEQAGMYFV